MQSGEFRKLAKLEDYQKIWRQADLIWIICVNPTLDVYDSLGLFLSVDPKSLERVFQQSSKGRYHRFYDFSAFHVPTLAVKPVLHIEPALILVGEKIILTMGNNIPDDALEEIEESIRNLMVLNQAASPSTICVRFIQEIIERNVNAIDTIAKATIDLEEEYASYSLNALLTEIQRIRHRQNELYQHLIIQRHIVDLMLQHVPRHLQLTEELRTLSGTSLAELEQQQQMLEINARSLTDLVSLHSILLANRLNRVIVLLTAVTVTVAVPSLIANILGMYNVLSTVPFFYLPGMIPVYTWQIQLIFLLPSIIIPLIWVLRKGWMGIYSPSESSK
ncbi:MAG: CorA family divalent cation transporter [Candidatus Thorarchaeota archaeon]